MEISEKPCECRFTINRGFKVAIISCDSNVKEGKLTIGFNFTSKVNVRMFRLVVGEGLVASRSEYCNGIL